MLVFGGVYILTILHCGTLKVDCFHRNFIQDMHPRIEVNADMLMNASTDSICSFPVSLCSHLKTNDFDQVQHGTTTSHLTQEKGTVFLPTNR